MKSYSEQVWFWCYCVSTAAVVLLLGCTSGAHVIPAIKLPTPLVDSFPKTVGIYYSPELLEYIHDEEISRYGRYVVELGDNQKEIFQSGLGAIFDKMITLDALPDASNVSTQVDGIFSPSIVGVNVGIPAVSGSEYFEVWIRYDLRLLQPDGSLIYRWLVPAYGKVNRREYGTGTERSSKALMRATEKALRNASTQMIMNFHQNLRPATVTNWINK